MDQELDQAFPPLFGVWSYEFWNFMSRGGALAGRFSLERAPAPAPTGFVAISRCLLRTSPFFAQKPPPELNHNNFAYCTWPGQLKAAGSKVSRERSFNITPR